VKNLRIQKQKNKKIIYDIYNEETFLGFLPKKSLFFIVERYLFEKDVIEISIDEEKYRELDKIIHKYLWNRFCDFLILREHSEWEAKEYLKRIHAPNNVINKFIEIAINMNYLNEERFVDVFIRSKISKNKSKKEIKTSLFMRHVNPDLIDKNLDFQYSVEDENAILNTNFDKALRKYNNFDDIRKRKEKIINFMMRKGFSYSKIRKLIESKIK